MSDYEIGVNQKAEDDFAYILYGVTAAELAAMLDAVCRPENRKYRNEGKVYINTKYVADLLGTTITVLVRSSTFFTDHERHREARYRAAGIPYSAPERTPIREYQITTDEWDVNCEIHIGSTSGTFVSSEPRGLGVVEGRKSTVSKPWFDGDVDTYLSQMSILRLMIPMLMEDAAWRE